jgi:putative restriction endonuclease
LPLQEAKVELIVNRQQIRQNIAELERIRAKTGGERRDYERLIERGTCFVPYESSHGRAFAPSRFIGYVDNTLSKHASNPEKDGKKTNPAIIAILGNRPVEDVDLNEQYREFCSLLGFEPRAKGNFNVARKFWKPM